MPIDFRNIFTAFADAAQQNSSKDALLYFRDGAYHSESYLSIYKRSLAFARILRSKGVKPGDRVAILLENRPEFCWACLAVFSCGAVIVPMDIQYSAQVISNLLEHSGAKLLVSFQKFMKECAGVQTKWICLDDVDLQKKITDLMGEAQTNLQCSDEEHAAFFYTSGTTAKPKAVVLTHRNLLVNVASIQQAGLVSPQDVAISILPLHHTYAFTTTLLCPLLTGMTISYPKSLASGELLACMKQTCTTLFIGVPQIFAIIHRSIKDQIAEMGMGTKALVGAAQQMAFVGRKLTRINVGKNIFKKIHQRFGPSLRVMVSGGARLDPAIARDFYQWGFTLVEGYGLTETSPVVSFSIPENPRFGSVGRPLPGVSIKIDNPNEQGEGEVIVKGGNVMKGYYNLTSETQKVLRDGWFFTGDVGRIDGDGFLFLTGRRKEMLVLSNGENINPEEIESYYGQDPFIKEIAVLTVRDEKKSVDLTRLVAIIVPDEEHFKKEEELHIYQRLKWELENYSTKLPTSVFYAPVKYTVRRSRLYIPNSHVPLFSLLKNMLGALSQRMIILSSISDWIR